VAPRVAARLGIGLTGDCIDLGLDAEGRLLQYKPAFGGRVVAPILSRTVPEMTTVRPGILGVTAVAEGGRAEVIRLPGPEREPRVRVVATTPIAEPSSVLDHAEIVVGFGKGIGSRENLHVVEDLAAVLGAPLCTTRDVTEAGWVPKHLQVGMTGRAIAPKLYIAIGIRGAFEHMVGVRRAGTIVGVNKNAKAPLFKSADLGLVEDFAVVVPLLTERLRAARAGMRPA
jgi:electron transfer flavoprotein alpha subunit